MAKQFSNIHGESVNEMDIGEHKRAEQMTWLKPGICGGYRPFLTVDSHDYDNLINIPLEIRKSKIIIQLKDVHCGI